MSQPARPARSQRALVLDFGGVISRTMFETHPLTEKALGLPPGTLRWQGPFDPVNDALWTDMQADRISERDYWMARTQETGRLVGEEWSRMEDFVRRARAGDPEAVIRPEALAAIHAAKAAGCKLAVLSNELDLFYGADFRRSLSFMDLFDVVVDATYTGILKPDTRAYALCCAELGLPPAACVFVDDQLRNVKGARQAGMQEVHFDVMAPAASFDLALGLLGIGSPSRAAVPTPTLPPHAP